MKNFTASQLIKSLIMPIGTFLFGAFGLGGEIISGSVYFTGYAAVRSLYYPLAVIVFGGILPIVMTIFRNIHTEQYFFKRLFMYGVCFMLSIIGGQMSFGILSTLLFIVILGVDVVYELVRVMDEDTAKGERVVMLLSDFFIWFCIDYFLMAFRELGSMTLL